MAITILVIALRFLHVPLEGIKRIKATRILVVVARPEILHLQRVIILLARVEVIRPGTVADPFVASEKDPVGIEAVALHHGAAGMRQQTRRAMPICEQGFAAVATVLAENVIADDIAAAEGAGAVEFLQDL